MKVSLYKKVLQQCGKRTGVLAALLASSALATHAQVVFSPPKNISNGPAAQFGEQMVVSPQGDIYLAWIGCNAPSSSNCIYFSHSADRGSTFSTPLQVSNNVKSEFDSPVIGLSLDSAGNIYIAWAAAGGAPGVPYGVFLSHSTDGGASFSPPVSVANGDARSVQLVVDPAGKIDMVWVAFTGQTEISPGEPPQYAYDFTAFFSQSIDGGNTFSLPTAVFSNQTGVTSGPSVQLAVDTTGNVYVLGTGATGEFVLLARSNNGGVSFAITNVENSNGSDPNSAQMALDAAGNINVAYSHIINRYHILFSRSTDGGVSFSSPQDLTPLSPEATSPKIALDSGGRIYLAWVEIEPNFNPYGTIFFSRSTDGGVTFSSPLALSTDPSGLSYFAGKWGSITVDSGGGVGVIWEDKTPAGDWEVLFSRSSDSGATFASPVSISGPGISGSTSLAPVMGVDANSNLYITWKHTDQWPGPLNVYFSRSVALSSVALSPADVMGGSLSTGTVTLSGPAPTGGAVISLSSSDPSVTVPGTVTIPEGTTSTTFIVTTNPVAAATTAIVPAVFNGVMQTASITVEPPVLTSLTLNPSSVTGRNSSTGTVTLSGPAPAGGAVVALSSSNTSVATVPASVTVPAGFSNATFTVNTSLEICPNSATITGSWSGVSRTASLAVMPIATLPSQACSRLGGHGRPRFGRLQ